MILRQSLTEVQGMEACPTRHRRPQRPALPKELARYGDDVRGQHVRRRASFWIPWSYDYRGRVYPQNTQLNPQGTDFDKSLLLFADEGPVNEYWLGWHAATTYGRDKDPHDARAQWARDNVELITQVAEDPIGNISLWEEADEPWMFLAAAIEYHATVITKQRHTSGLPIGIDATCSGLQHLASMTRDGRLQLKSM